MTRTRGPRRTETEREHDRECVAALSLRGKRQVEIATKLGVSQQQVSYDLKEIRKRWRESSVMNMNEATQQQLTRIDELERTYWDAWELSTNGKRVGNPTFLSGVQWCIEQRCKIFGLYVGTNISVDWRKTVEAQGYDADIILERVVNAYRVALESDS